MFDAAPVRARQVPPVVRTSGMVLSALAVSPPEMVSISPLASASTDGYQRPLRMSGPAVQLLVAKS